MQIYGQTGFEVSISRCWRVFRFFLPEIGEKLKKHKKGKMFDPDIAEWMGFTYRQLQLEMGIKSKELVNRITFYDMLRLYPGMHTIDELDAAERISEMYNLVDA